MKINKKILSILLFTVAAPFGNFAQTPEIDAPLLNFNRGKLWHSIYFGKSGPGSFDNWRKNGIGLDWPGFDATKIKEEIGGAPSYMASGGMYIGCKKYNDSVLAFEDWAMYAPSVSNEVTAKYIVKKHKKYSDNLGTLVNNSRGEEVIETEWEYNPNFPNNNFEPERQIPIRVKRTAHQWNGSMRDENYIIYEYVIKNIANELTQYKAARRIVDTLKDFRLMFSYAIHCNSRSWNILFPTQIAGARNTRYQIAELNESSRKDFNTGLPRPMIYGWAGDYKDPETSNTINVSFGRSITQGQKVKNPVTGEMATLGEWLSPGYAGVRLLYSTPDKIKNKATSVTKYGWSAVENNQDLAGPITGKTGLYEASYAVIADPSTAFNAVSAPSDQLMGARRLWSMMALGPWDLLPGDSIVVAVAEIVDGIDYSKATGANMYPLSAGNLVSSTGRTAFEQSADKAKFTYDNKFNHPDPPMAPPFKVDFYKKTKNFVANEITWTTEKENIPDPDDKVLDFSGYRLYRSNYLPIGPWIKVVDIPAGNPKYLSGNTYTYVDSAVEVGSSYYYALTAYDKGRDNWIVNPSAKFTETNSVKVPSLESSIFANRSATSFTATLTPPDNLSNVLVVPNPFVIGEGSSQPGESDVIQFVNIPNPCTIKIFTLRGDLIKTLKADEKTGAIISWDQATDYGQFVQSGLYIYHLDSPIGKKIGKFAIIR